MIYGILCLPWKETPRMASVRFVDLQSRPTEFLDFTSLTLDEFQLLAPPFEAAFQAHMAAWRLDGKPRTARWFSVYQNAPCRRFCQLVEADIVTRQTETLPPVLPVS